jgi:hypothetical protein
MHPAQASRGDLTAITSYDPLRVVGRVVRRSTHHGRWSRRLVCPLVRGVSSSSSSGLTWPRQRAFASGHESRYPAGYPRRPAGGLAQLPWFPAAFPPPAFASWSSWSRQGIGPSSRSAHRHANTSRTQTGFPRSARTSYDRGGCPSTPRGRRCSPGLATITSPRLPYLNGTSLDPATTTHPCEALLDEASTRVYAIHPSGFPLACGSRMERAPLGFPPSFAPRPYERRTSGWGQATEHGPKQRSMSST